VSYAKRKEIDWAARKTELETILAQMRNPCGYDCIVPSSGGKDSHYQVMTLLGMGARPLVVTASTCQLTSIGRMNIDMVWATIVGAGVAGSLFYALLTAVERRATFWHASYRQGS
jgi:hypothetical protein